MFKIYVELKNEENSSIRFLAGTIREKGKSFFFDAGTEKRTTMPKDTIHLLKIDGEQVYPKEIEHLQNDVMHEYQNNESDIEKLKAEYENRIALLKTHINNRDEELSNLQSKYAIEKELSIRSEMKEFKELNCEINRLKDDIEFMKGLFVHGISAAEVPYFGLKRYIITEIGNPEDYGRLKEIMEGEE